MYFNITTLVNITVKKSPLDRQTLGAFPVGVGDGMGVTLGAGVSEAVGEGLFVFVLEFVLVGIRGSAPVMATNSNWTRAWAEVVSSPKKRKFGVWYGSGKPSKSL